MNEMNPKLKPFAVCKWFLENPASELSTRDLCNKFYIRSRRCVGAHFRRILDLGYISSRLENKRAIYFAGPNIAEFGSILSGAVKPPKKDCGGVRCLEDIRERCVIDSETDCWNLALGMSGCRTPTVYSPKSEKIEQAPRMAWLFRGNEIPEGHRVWRTCLNHKCCNPEHLACGTQADMGRWQKQTGVQKGIPSKVAANVRMGKLRRKVSDEGIAEICSSSETLDVLAKRFGVSTYAVSMYRRRLRGTVPLMRGASVFGWRPA